MLTKEWILAATALLASLGVFAQGPAAKAAASQPASAPASQAAATTALKPGVWETSTVVENPAANSRRQLVARSCITPADATKPERVIPQQREAGMQCENRDLKRDGANWVWAFSCKSADASQNGTGKLAIMGDSFLGRGEAELRAKGAKPVKVAQTFAGKWVQACS